MKKVINGKIYNTSTAKWCGSYSPHPYQSYSNWYCETLYQKKTGEFFIYGEGNANSKYSRSCGQNEWCGDAEIIPMTYTDAQEWAEKHLDGDEYVAIFGEPEEDDSKQTLNIYVSKSLAANLKNEATKRNISIGDFITILLNEHYT